MKCVCIVVYGLGTAISVTKQFVAISVIMVYTLMYIYRYRVKCLSGYCIHNC